MGTVKFIPKKIFEKIFQVKEPAECYLKRLHWLKSVIYTQFLRALIRKYEKI